MAKKCPPGVLCIENFTIVTIIIISIGVVYFMHRHYLFQNLIMYKLQDKPAQIIKHVPTQTKIHTQQPPPPPTTININDTRNGDITSDPYVPPLKPAQQGIVSVRTRGGRLQRYKQVGYLKFSSGNKHGRRHGRHHGIHHGRHHSMIPLFGRPLDSSRNKWNYYTIHNGIKLQVNNNSRSCTNEYGCDELFTGDVVYVDGIDNLFQVTVYETSSFRYSPNIL